MGLKTYLLALVKPKPKVKKQELAPYLQSVVDAAPSFREIAKRNDMGISSKEEGIFAMAAIRKSERLQQCTVTSLRSAFIHIATVGLTLNPAYAYCYLVPHGSEAVLYVSYKGLTKLATDTGAVNSAVADIVRANDEFVFNGKYDKVTHKFKPQGNRGEIIGAYCMARLHDGTIMSEWMDKTQIDKCRDAAKTKKVWDMWYEEMAKKSVIKRASKTWPKSARTERLDNVVSFMNDYEGIDTDKSDDTGEPVLLFSDAQIADLKKLLTSVGHKHPDRQLNNMARSMGHEDITQVPSDSFEKSKNMLLAGLSRLASVGK